MLKFATAPFRAGRTLDGAIDELVEQMKAQRRPAAGQDPADKAAQTQLQIEQMKITYAREKDTADRQVKLQQIQSDANTGFAKAQTEAQTSAAEIAGRQQESYAKTQQINMQAANQQRESAMDQQTAAMKAQADMQKHSAQMQANAQKQQRDAEMAQFRSMQPRGRPV